MQYHQELKERRGANSLRNIQIVAPFQRTVTERFMFIGTQCDLWGKPDGTGHEK